MDLDGSFTVETLIYRVSNGHLLWASMSEGKDPKDLRQLVHKLVGDVIKDLRKDRLLAREAR